MSANASFISSKIFFLLAKLKTLGGFFSIVHHKNERFHSSKILKILQKKVSKVENFFEEDPFSILASRQKFGVSNLAPELGFLMPR